MMIRVRRGPLRTTEFRRILALPQRDPDEFGAALAGDLTVMLKKKEGTMSLWPLQALALAEAAAYDGVFCALPVGQGKTLVSFLLPTVMDSTRALLLVRGSLRDKTFKDFYYLSKHWIRHDTYFVSTYEHVSTHPEYLEEIRPDLIVADEAHRLKNKNAGCTKRVIKYWKDSGNTRFVPLSGTLATRSFYDYWHLQLMALPSKMGILPYDYKEAELWSQALDVEPGVRAGLGALEVFGEDMHSARKGFGQFIRKVPGVIYSDSEDVKASISLEIKEVENKKIKDAYNQLFSMWMLPNEDLICTGAEFYRHAREIALGFYYVWKYPPPDYWAEARRKYGSFVRYKLKYSKKYETASQIDSAYADDPAVFNWKAVEKEFTPETEAVWFAPEMLRKFVLSILDIDALVWYRHKAVGELLNEFMPVFGSKGEDIETGAHIYDQSKQTIAVSINAMSEGFNLQQWSSNVVLSPPANGRLWEQMIGRTHRNGQKSDEVDIAVLATLPTAYDDLRKAKKDAEYIEATTTQRQKLNFAVREL